ncbi:MAG: pyruvate carboxylase [Opitutales bacterium]
MKKILVSNRSEIAIRIFRSATELGLRTVAVYPQEDRFGVHRFKADEAYLIGKGKGPVAAYLDIDEIISLAREKGVDMIHPGYGFLAENATFARACIDAGITFVGPRPEVLELMGDKIAARKLANKAGVPMLPGTEEPIEDPETALRVGREIGFPLIIKAAHGGGGRGMRVVNREEDLKELLDEARGEAERAFGNPAVFLERYIARAKHIEVQIMGDRHGNILHLHERDCSVQRRHQKVVEIAPSVELNEETRRELCEAAVRIGREIHYDNAGTVEFLLDCDTQEWFFIEMNPRIQVEHTVTEVITGLDIVRAQIQVAEGHSLHSREVAFPEQEKVARNGFAIQCRITTEDPENAFTPDYGKILSYRSAAGFGIRLDGAMGDTGSVITPFYDSLLVKVTASGPDFDTALRRMDRALREFRIRGVKTNIPFLENVIHHDVFQAGEATTRMIDTTPELFSFGPRRDRASKLLAYLGNVIVNGNPQLKGRKVEHTPPRPVPPAYDHKAGPPAGTRDYLLKHGPEKFARWTLEQEKLLITDTTLRDAHQSLLAARLRTFDMLAVADAVSRRASGLYSLEMWGGATFDTSMRFLHEDPYQRLRLLREKIPNICFQMLLRGANGVGYSNYPDNVVNEFISHAAEAGIDIFRIFDSLNYLPNLKVAMDAVVNKTGAVCEAAICYSGDILDPARQKYSLKYYVDLAKELEKMGAHVLAIKDMAGLCKPYAATRLVKALKEEIGIPVHFHTHDSSGIAGASVLRAGDAGVDVVDCALAPLSGSTSQPNLNSIVAALRNTPRDTGLDVSALNEFATYWEQVREIYKPFDTSPPYGSAEVYFHEMPGGQYTNLKEQAAAMGLSHRWQEIVRCYAEVNELFGDIIKVTPSSKVVGDMAMFLISRGIKPKDVPNLEPGTPFPSSVIDLLAGGLGQPLGGWPEKLQHVVLGDKKPNDGRPGEGVPPLDLEKERENLELKIGRKAGGDDLFCHLMYPQVFEEFVEFQGQYGDVSVLPSSAFLSGLKPGEEVSVDIEEGKTLFIKLIHVGEVDSNGYRPITFELNGRPRESAVLDRSVQAETKPKVKADPGDSSQVGAPIPGVITSLGVSVGSKVEKGNKLLTLEAMKMQTTVYAPADGVVEEILIEVGDSVESKDLLVRLRGA